MKTAWEALRALGGNGKDVSAHSKRIAEHEAMIAELEAQREQAQAEIARHEQAVTSAAKIADAKASLAALTEARWKVEVLDGAIATRRAALDEEIASAEQTAHEGLERQRARIEAEIRTLGDANRAAVRELIEKDLLPRCEQLVSLAGRYRTAQGESLPWAGLPPAVLAREVLQEFVLMFAPGAALYGWADGSAQAEARRFRGLP